MHDYLYTYLPKRNTAAIDGILATGLTERGYEKYRERTGKRTKEDVLAELDSWKPGFRRSLAISALTNPITDDAPAEFIAFRDAKKLYRIDAAKLLAAGLITRIESANTGNRRGTHTVKRWMNRDIDWSKKQPGAFLFSNVPHYLLEMKRGRIPAEYIDEMR